MKLGMNIMPLWVKHHIHTLKFPKINNYNIEATHICEAKNE